MQKQKVLVTRAKKQSSEFIRNLEHSGFEVITLPMIRTELVSNLSSIQHALSSLEQYDWLVFTSENAVRYFFQVADNQGIKFYFYPNLKIATVGEKTKQKLEQLGYRTNFVPIKYTAETLAENMDELTDKKVLIPRSSIAKDNYVKAMEKSGATVEAINLYQTLPIVYTDQEFKRNMSQAIDFLTFASPSSIEAFHANVERSNFTLNNEKIICIGPSTAKKAILLGYEVQAVAELHTTEGIIEAIKKI